MPLSVIVLLVVDDILGVTMSLLCTQASHACQAVAKNASMATTADEMAIQSELDRPTSEAGMVIFDSTFLELDRHRKFVVTEINVLAVY